MDWFSLFRGIEATGLSVWVRESQSLLAFPAILIVHAIGMALLVGVTAAMDLRIFGFAPRIPLSSLEELVPAMKVGFWLNATSGLLLVIGFPIKHLTNPVFFVKLSLIALALVDTQLMLKHIVRSTQDHTSVRLKERVLAGGSLLLWTGSIVAGKLLYYTFTRRDPFGNPY
jgi:hypothetical protein